MILAWLKKIFYLDYRSLGLFRIGLALVSLADLFNRIWYVREHYTDFGVLPRHILLKDYLHPLKFSLHLISGEVEFQIFLFALHAIFLLALLIGFKTKLSSILSWVMIVSLHNRNAFVLQGGDVLLRMLFFWSMFLPLGHCFSLDAKKDPLTKKHHSLAGASVLIQVAAVYWFTIAFKYGDEWRENFSAVYYALQIDQFTTSLGRWLGQQYSLLKPLTILTFFIELIPPIIIFIPIRGLRMICLSLMIGLHLSFAFFMELGLFPYISSLSWLLFLPTSFWQFSLIQKWEKKLKDQWTPLRQKIKSFLPPTQNSETSFQFSWVNSSLALFFLINIIIYNIHSLDGTPIPFPPKLEKFYHVFRFDQKWRMFSPRPSLDDGWYVIPGTLADGSEVNVFTPEEKLFWEKPKLVSETYLSQRWRKYLMNIRHNDHEAHRLHFGRWLCRRWNEEHEGDQRLNKFQIYFMQEKTLPQYQHLNQEPQQLTLWRHRCFDKDLYQEYLAKNHQEGIRTMKELPGDQASRELSSTKN